MRTDHDAVVGMTLGEQQLEDGFLGHAVGRVLGALPPLVAHDVLLVGKRLLIDDVQQIAHAIGLEPQRELDLVRRQRLEVVGEIEVG